jgi:hypothetical protein
MPADRPVRAPAWLALLLAVAAAGCTAAPGRPGVAATTAPATTASTVAAAPAGRVLAGFVAFGDFGGGLDQPGVAAAMARWAAGHRVDALVTTGDNVYERGEPGRFDAQLAEPYRALRRTRPLWATLGNHDVVAGHGAEELRYLHLPDLPYARQLPGVRLYFLDANRPDPSQAAWLQRQLAAPGPRLRVVVFHQPAWSCSYHDSTPAVDQLWVPLFERYRVALVLNGHDHNYQRFQSAQGVTYVVTGGGGKELYPIEPCPGGVPPRQAAARRHHFTAVEVRQGSLTVTAVADDGTVLDRAVIRR